MKEKFKIWWKEYGQIVGFVSIVTYLNVYFLCLGNAMQSNKLLAIGWLVSFFSLCGWYAWQSKIHGWRLPKDIKNTH
jgi:hypothetical protein